MSLSAPMTMPLGDMSMATTSVKPVATAKGWQVPAEHAPAPHECPHFPQCSLDVFRSAVHVAASAVASAEASEGLRASTTRAPASAGGAASDVAVGSFALEGLSTPS